MTSNVPLSSMNRHLVIGTLVVSTYKYLAFDQSVSGHAQAGDVLNFLDGTMAMLGRGPSAQQQSSDDDSISSRGGESVI